MTRQISVLLLCWLFQACGKSSSSNSVNGDQTSPSPSDSATALPPLPEGFAAVGCDEGDEVTHPAEEKFFGVGPTCSYVVSSLESTDPKITDYCKDKAFGTRILVTDFISPSFRLPHLWQQSVMCKGSLDDSHIRIVNHPSEAIIEKIDSDAQIKAIYYLVFFDKSASATLGHLGTAIHHLALFDKSDGYVRSLEGVCYGDNGEAQGRASFSATPSVNDDFCGVDLGGASRVSFSDASDFRKISIKTADGLAHPVQLVRIYPEHSHAKTLLFDTKALSLPDSAAQDSTNLTTLSFVNWGSASVSQPMRRSFSLFNDTQPSIMSTLSEPTAISENFSVAMGKKIFFYGGKDNQNTFVTTGGIFDPSTNSWQSLPTSANAPLRSSSGSSSAFIGGANEQLVTVIQKDLSNGAIFNTDHLSWTKIPAVTFGESVQYYLWDGPDLYAFGDTKGVAYSATSNTWTDISAPLIPLSKLWVKMAKTYTGIAVLGVEKAKRVFGTEARVFQIYDIKNDKWENLPLTGAPSARTSQLFTFTNGGLLIWGGGAFGINDDYTYCNDGGFFDLQTQTWSRVIPRNWQAFSPGLPPANQFVELTDHKFIILGTVVNLKNTAGATYYPTGGIQAFEMQLGL